MDEFRLEDLFDPGDKKMVHHPVPEIGREDLPVFRLFCYKADRAGWLVTAVRKSLAEVAEVVQKGLLEPQRIDCIPLSPPARGIGIIQVSEGIHVTTFRHARTGHTCCCSYCCC